jgi:hypothetical protein
LKSIGGGGGGDSLIGGMGADTFHLRGWSDSTVDPAGQDVIGDFSILAGDLIGLLDLDADASQPGDQAFTFIGAAAFTGAGQLRAEILGGMTVVAGDGNGDGAADFMPRLNGVHALSATNFLL